MKRKPPAFIGPDADRKMAEWKASRHRNREEREIRKLLSLTFADRVKVTHLPMPTASTLATMARKLYPHKDDFEVWKRVIIQIERSMLMKADWYLLAEFRSMRDGQIRVNFPESQQKRIERLVAVGLLRETAWFNTTGYALA